MFQIIQIVLLAFTLQKVAKILLTVAVIAGAIVLTTEAIEFVVSYLQTFENPVVMGQEVLLLEWFLYLGLDKALSVVLGAHSSVFTLRMLYRTLGWM